MVRDVLTRALKRCAWYGAVAIIFLAARQWRAAQWFGLWTVLTFGDTYLDSVTAPRWRTGARLLGVLVPTVMAFMELVQRQYVWVLAYSAVAVWWMRALHVKRLP